jgi:hypothetical protein
MDTQIETTNPAFVFHRIPTEVSRKDFNRYINSHVKSPTKGPQPQLALSKIFHDILYVLHTGIQWDQLKTTRNALHDTNVYQWHNRWSKDGSYQALFAAAVIHLHHTAQLDTSVLHGDGSHTVVKKGASASGMPVISTRKGTKN